MTTSLTHIALHVREFDPVVAFYIDYCGLELVHQRSDKKVKVAWLTEPGRGEDFVIVLIGGGPGHVRQKADFGHLGFALDSREAVDTIAEKAKTADCLVWPPKQEPAPTGYYCGIADPDGNVAEFSYGQPLRPTLPENN